MDDAQADLDFCLDLLGMRLVKKTVNFDNHHVYHFYYGNERGEPGTIWTTFPYKGHGVRVGHEGRRPGRHDGVLGAGRVARVLAQSACAWRACRQTTSKPHFGEPAIAFNDPSGLAVRAGRERSRHARAVDRRRSAKAARSAGCTASSMEVQRAQPSIDFLINVLGYHVVGASGGRTRMAAGGDAPGHLIDVLEQPDAKPAVNGVGTVHHVAMAIGSDEEQVRLREELLAARRSRHRRSRPQLLPLDLFPRARRRAVRGRDGCSRASRLTNRRPRSGAT